METRQRISFRDLPIRTKLLLGYIIVFLFAVGLGSIFLYSSVRGTLESNIESELRTSTLGILNMVRTATDASIKNHLRAVAETNEEIVRFYYEQFRTGLLTEDEAKTMAGKALLSQIIGKTGYIYCIDSKGIIQVHPQEALMGEDLSKYEFIQKQKIARQGYLEYDWANPGEEKTRPKGLYMTYFGPWDWIISVSSYREEFTELFRVDDIRDSILALTFGQTGYPYIMNSKGLLIIHPKLEGANIYDSTDSSGRRFIQEVCEKKNGKIIYPWMNPGETTAREKLVIFNYIPELDWIVASSSYLREFYRPLNAVGVTVLLTVGAMVILIIPMTWWLSTLITRPLRGLMQRFALAADGDYSGRMEVTGRDEIGKLADYYNSFIERLEESRRRLETSEHEYRSIFENALEGIFQSTPSGRFLSANPSMATLLGYNEPEQLMREIRDINIQLYEDPAQRDDMLARLMDKGFVTNFETRLLQRDGTPIWISMSARGIFDDAGNLVRLEGFVTDISKKKEYEVAQERAKVILEERVEERTAELSSWVNELTRSKLEGDYLRELGEHLQVCRQVEETYPLIRHYLEKLFPGDIASLFMRDEKSQMLGMVLSTDESSAKVSVIDMEDCWALRKGKPHLMVPSESSLVCSHLGGTPEYGSLCLPLIAQDELVGMLQLVFGKPGPKSPNSLEEQLERKKRLGAIITEHLALALTNIHLRETLRLQSIQDPLTGLYNRRYMEEILRREIFRIKRHGSHISIILLDVDYFKSVNDTYGHDAGDALLHDLAVYLQANIRAEDVACRYGGEEFMLIMIGMDHTTAARKAEELREGIKKGVRIRQGDEILSVTVSLGVASAPAHGEALDKVIRAADSALYLAKEGGRDRVEVASRETDG